MSSFATGIGLVSRFWGGSFVKVSAFDRYFVGVSSCVEIRVDAEQELVTSL